MDAGVEYLKIIRDDLRVLGKFDESNRKDHTAKLQAWMKKIFEIVVPQAVLPDVRTIADHKDHVMVYRMVNGVEFMASAGTRNFCFNIQTNDGLKNEIIIPLFDGVDRELPEVIFCETIKMAYHLP